MIYPKLSDGTIDWCVMCKHEGSDFFDLCCECEYPENSDDPPTKYEPKLMTNGDRIRSMSDEELAELMCHNVSNGTVNCAFCAAAEFCRMGHNGWLDWLKQEADE